jgi:predicted  nucleic acid-binding Zn-ribbon protein
MDDALQRFLEGHFDRLETSISKLENSISRVHDKLEVTNKETTNNTKDIEHVKLELLDTRGIFDDKLKGFRIGTEACQSNCKGFRDELKVLMDDKDSASETRVKNWIMGLGVSVMVTLAISIILKFVR